jgi:adenine-specific DNA-methyltransferase
MPTLDWIGKKAVLNHHQEVPYHLLKCDAKLSVGDPGSGNLLVQGDNLLALKALLPYYAGKIKCIYIDPPYNTGNENWVYNDNVNSPEIQKWLGEVVGKEAEDLSRHDKWLCMMYPRLMLLRELLRRDGIMFASIDDHEVFHLRMLLNEVFGPQNFIAEIVWEGAVKNDSRFISISHDYVLCYAREKEFLRINKSRWRTRKEGIDQIYKKVEALKRVHGEDYAAITADLRAWYAGLSKKSPAWAHRHYSKVDSRGVYFPSDISWPGGGGPQYEVLHPITKLSVRIPARGWVFPSPERMAEFIADDRVDFGEDESKVPTLKRYLHETEGQVLPSVIYKDRRAAMQRLRQMFGKEVFENPKDEEILAKLFEAVTNDGDIILDSFAGSGSTGHAVMNLNKLVSCF